MQITGGCHCGQVTYEAEVDPSAVEICHCTDCQTLSGSAFRTVVPALEGTFKLLSGEPRTYVKYSESGTPRAQVFCPNCGSHLYSCSPEGSASFFGIRVGTVHQRDQLKPQAQYWCRSAQPWVMDLEAITKFETQ